jgi:hypothetical protein
VYYNSILRWIRVQLDLSFKRPIFLRGYGLSFFYLCIPPTRIRTIFLIVRLWRERAVAISAPPINQEEMTC